MTQINPVILCGGVGTRLWPLSRQHQPKQFQPINSEGTTFFQATVQRHGGRLFGKPVVLVNERHLPTVTRQLRTIMTDAMIIGEPVSRNTGPALLAAALYLYEQDPDAVLLALPSDHVIDGNLEPSIASALSAVQDGLIVTFGIAPRYPESGYGYIIDGGPYIGYDGVRKAARFVEKPAAEIAEALIEEGGAFWASGISLFRADTLIAEYSRIVPKTLLAVKEAKRLAEVTASGIILEAEAFSRSRNDSTESTIFEKTDLMALFPADVQWDDVGAWSAFHTIGAKDDSGNVSSGDVILLDTQNSYVRGGNKLIAVVGLNDVIVVDTPDALLVTSRSASQKVKKVVEMLAQTSRPEIIDHRWLNTDWGRVGTISEGGGYSIKQLVLNAGGTVLFDSSSTQRSLLTVAEGVAQVESEAGRRVLGVGATFEVGPQVRAILSNVGTTALQVIEVTCEIESRETTEPAQTGAAFDAMAVGKKLGQYA
ncbi:mannose-1-phosphate guanylyltransferase/mannose-6-phosphate isomerase [Devosia sp. UYZn731]|uniref:mannose-1-phosphate guanylyltransferase/mannose-6-phosphate isomerase n=1 Tax=Devosia sp. UYZn731 TaxID=3156345 RepID=UPI003398BE8F